MVTVDNIETVYIMDVTEKEKATLDTLRQLNGGSYELVDETGPAHDKTFTVEVYCEGKALAIVSVLYAVITTTGTFAETAILKTAA